MKILWQSKSPNVALAYSQGSDSAFINGGNAYDVEAVRVLSQNFDIGVDNFTIRRKGESVLKYWWRMSRYKAPAELLIMEPFPIVYGNRSDAQKSIAMIHHIDPVIMNDGIYHRWYFNRLLRRARYCDMIVTVSEYWKNYFVQQGSTHVEVIYNSFDPEKYGAVKESETSFRQRLGIPTDKKIVYIGNALKEKGVYEVYEALKSSPYHLVMTGKENKAPGLPVQHLNLSREDYLSLLKFSSVVISFSLMVEGWNRIAHEALLSGTPVIGSGSGGMHELLSGAGQPIVDAQENLASAVEQVLASREEYVKRGYAYVHKFDKTYFLRRWKEVVETVMEGKVKI
ncbi:MAG: glycosyltransferase family 4 protein [Bacteroidia bacterium]